jgi:predicted alpha/beta-fold hydrolase
MKNSFIPDDEKDFTGVKSMHDFDVKIGHKYRGNTPESSQDAFAVGAANRLVGNVRAPTLMLSADNDPFTLKELAPSDEVRRSDKTVLVRTKEGAHVSFLYGWLGRKSLIDDIVPEWFEQIMRAAVE